LRIVKDTYDQLLDFQKEGVEFLAKSRSALLADQLGVGKTVQAIHAAQAVGARRILVICTASIKHNWKKEGEKWGYDPKDIHVIDRNTIDSLPEEGMFIINYYLIWRKRYVKVLAKRRYDVLICDECHALKNHNSKRAKAVWGQGGYLSLAVYRWMLTATPVLNRPVELHAMLNALCPERLGAYKNYISYTQRYCNGHDGNWGWDASGADNLEELAGRLEGFMLRRTRDCLPEKTLQKIYMPVSHEIEKKLFNGEESESIRRKIGEGKVKPCVEHIRDILEDEEKVLVFAYHRKVVEELQKELKDYGAVKLYGSTPSKDRQKVIDAFSTDPDTRVFVGQINAAGEGIDGLQNNCSVGVFVEICHTPGVINQAIGRLHRQGQKQKCLFQFLIIENTIEEKILDSTILKEHNIKTVLKDDRIGLDFTNPKTEEDEMSLETEMKRIADTLEEICEFLKTPLQTEVTYNSPAKPAAEPAKDEKPEPEVEEKTKKKKEKKTKTKKKPKKKTENKEPEKKEDSFQDRMNAAANLISGFYSDTSITNNTFKELTTKFKKEFPQYGTIIDVEEKDQAACEKMVMDFIKEKGIS
jgi:SWI/SNF-related matrix-associated actin-dependent regulator 1 of chromatin subfamily A